MTRVSFRKYAKAYVGLMRDQDFLMLESDERQLFTGLWMDPDINNAGVFPWRPEQMAYLIGGSATPEDVRRCASVLQERKYVFVDESTGELLVRSYIRHDDVVRQPNMVKPMLAAFTATRSPMLRQLIINELHRLRDEHRPRSGKADGFQNDDLIHLLVNNPPSRAPDVLRAWAAHNPHRPVVATPVDDFQPATAGPAWTPVDTFTPSADGPLESTPDPGEGLGGRVGGKGSPNPPVNPLPQVGEGLRGTPGGRGGVTTTSTNYKNTRSFVAPTAQRDTDPDKPPELGLFHALPGGKVTDADATSDDRDPVAAEYEQVWKTWAGMNPGDRSRGAKPKGLTAYRAWRKKFPDVPVAKLVDGIVPVWNAATSDQYVPHVDRFIREQLWRPPFGAAVRDRVRDGNLTDEQRRANHDLVGAHRGPAPFENPTDPAAYAGQLGGRRRREAEERREQQAGGSPTGPAMAQFA